MAVGDAALDDARAGTSVASGSGAEGGGVQVGTSGAPADKPRAVRAWSRSRTPRARAAAETRIASSTARVARAIASRARTSFCRDRNAAATAARASSTRARACPTSGAGTGSPVRFPDEFFGADYAAETITALDTGIGRAIELENGTSSWTKKTGNVVRGFVSRIDGGCEPYRLTIPASYDGKRPMRLDVWLHGTQQQLNEVRFLQQQAGPHQTSQILADDYIMVEPFARMNDWYKFYAETDVFEVIAAVRKHYNIDAERIVIRGHSMGGHQGSGRLALQNPTFFGAYEASAGYSETKEYAGNRLPKEGLTPYQEAALHYVDAEDYALNAFNVPGVSYGGEKDAQLRASTRFREAIVREGFQLTKESPYKWTTKDLRLLFLVGPDTGHAWHKDSKARIRGVHPQSAGRDGGQSAESRAVRHLHDEIQQRPLDDDRAARRKLQARRRGRQAIPTT